MGIGLETLRQMLLAEFIPSASAPAGNHIIFAANALVSRMTNIAASADIPIDYSAAPAIAAEKEYAVGTRVKFTTIAPSVLPALSTTKVYYVCSVTGTGAGATIQISETPTLTDDPSIAIIFTAGGAVTLTDLQITETLGSGVSADHSEIFAMADAVRYEINLQKDRPSWFVAATNPPKLGRPRNTSTGVLQTTGSQRALVARGKIGEVTNDVSTSDIAYDGIILLKSGAAAFRDSTGVVSFVSENVAAGQTLDVGVPTTARAEISMVPEF